MRLPFLPVALRVGINGFGRIGRLALRAAWDRHDIDVVHMSPDGTQVKVLAWYDNGRGHANRLVEPAALAGRRSAAV
jgi:glyceraldehyde 3-phosphate dehydrogenase